MGLKKINMQEKIFLTDEDIEKIISGETTEYEDVMKYAPYMAEGKVPQLTCLPVRIGKYEVEFTFPYFTTYCKAIGQPDYAFLSVKIIPDGQILEMKSLKMYLQGFRNMDIYQEEATNVIFIDMVKTCKPLFMSIDAQWDPRGSMGTNVHIVYKNKRFIADEI